MEGVTVLHGEFAAAHHAETRAALIPEFGLDLVQVQRELAPALELAPGDIGDGLFGGRLEHEIALVPVLEAQQFGPVGLEAPGLLPQFGRLDHGHGEFDRARAVHLLAHDGLDLAHHAQAEGHPGVDPAGEAPDEACPQHQPVAGELGFGRGFLEGR